MGGMIDESSSPEECNQNGNKALAAGDHTSAVQVRRSSDQNRSFQTKLAVYHLTHIVV